MGRQQGVLRSLNGGALVLQPGGGEAGDRRLVAPQSAPSAVADSSARVLVVDPDPAAFETCRVVLGGQGYQLSHAADLASARAHVEGGVCDLVILELDLSNEDGLAFCREVAGRQVREGSAARILIHSRRAQSIDRVAGLEFGADDYIDKSCHPVEFLARVRAVLRRGGAPTTAAAPGPQVHVFDHWRYDDQSGALASPLGRSAWLAPGEQALLRVFLDHPRELLTRVRIQQAMYGQAQALSGRVIDVRVVRLRRGFETCAPGGGDLIRTVRGAGYLLRATVSHRPPAA